MIKMICGWIWYIQIIFVGVFGVMGIWMDAKLGKDKQPKRRYKSPLSYFQPESKVERIFSAVQKVGIYTCIETFVLFLLVLPNKILITNENLYSIEGIVMGFVAIVMAIAVLAGSLPVKEYYFSVTREDIIKKYHLYTAYVLIITVALRSVICVLLWPEGFEQLNEWLIGLLFEVSIVMILSVGGYTVIIVGKILMDTQKTELNSNNSLYKIFWNNAPLNCTNRTKQAMETNLGYLLGSYKKLTFWNKEVREVTGIEYVENIEPEGKWGKLSVNIALIANVILFLIEALFCALEKEKIFGGISFGIFVVTSGLWYLMKLGKMNARYLMEFIVGGRGYLVFEGESEKLIGEVCLYKNPDLKKFIYSIKNMMAIYCIATTCFKNDEADLIEEIILDMLEDLKQYEREEKSNFARALYYVPVFTCAYFIYGNEKKPQNRKLKAGLSKLYQTFSLSDSEREKYHAVLNSFIYDACRYREMQIDREQKEKKKSECMEKYIDDIGYWQFISENEKRVVVHNKRKKI